MKIETTSILGYEGKEGTKGNEGKEALKEGPEEAFKVKEVPKEACKEALKVPKEALKEALKEAFREALRVQELRSFVPLYGRDDSFCHGGDGD